MNTESRCLLNGKIYCADCGSRLIVSANGRFVIDNGIQQKRLRYTCYGKYSKRTECHGQTGYSVARLDGIIDGVVRHIFERMQSIPKSEVVNSGLMALKHEQEVCFKATQRDYDKVTTDLSALKAEVLNAIRGESKFSPDLLSELISQSEKQLAELDTVRKSAKQGLDNCNFRIEELQEKFDEIISWTDLYDAADLSAKKMIIANLINRIEVGADYQIHIDLNIDLEHFNIQLDICSFKQDKTA